MAQDSPAGQEHTHGHSTNTTSSGTIRFVPTGIYLHIPFCRIKCPYCDFNTFAGIDDQMPAYLEALHQELELRLQEASEQPFGPHSLYFGGGTPSLLEPTQVAELVSTVERIAKPPRPMEVTLEANPGTVDLERLRAFRAAGINRLTIGCQTFEPELLAELGRLHSVPESLDAVESALAAGFTNLNLDLMFGLPGQRLEQLEGDLQTITSLGATHLSLYNLTVEQGTPFGARQRLGSLTLPSEELQRAMWERALEATEASGYQRYEVSNFARRGAECVHNKLYWSRSSWLGVGAGAHGHAAATPDAPFGRRWWNIRSPRGYAESLHKGELPTVGHEVLTEQQAIDESIMLGLRTQAGLDIRELFGAAFPSVHQALRESLRAPVDAGLLQWTNSQLMTTREGCLVLDALVEQVARTVASLRAQYGHSGWNRASSL